MEEISVWCTVCLPPPQHRATVPSTDCILQQTKCKLPQTSLCCPTPHWHSHCRFILRLEHHQRFWLVRHIGVALVKQIKCGKIGKTEWKMCKTRQKLGKIFRTSYCHKWLSWQKFFSFLVYVTNIPHTIHLFTFFSIPSKNNTFSHLTRVYR